MKFFIGFLIIALAVGTVIKYKPKSEHIKQMFFVEVCFGVFVMMSKLNFSSALNVCLSLLIIVGAVMMSLCFFGEVYFTARKSADKTVPSKSNTAVLNSKQRKVKSPVIAGVKRRYPSAKNGECYAIAPQNYSNVHGKHGKKAIA